MLRTLDSRVDVSRLGPVVLNGFLARSDLNDEKERDKG